MIRTFLFDIFFEDLQTDISHSNTTGKSHVLEHQKKKKSLHFFFL